MDTKTSILIAIDNLRLEHSHGQITLEEYSLKLNNLLDQLNLNQKALAE